MRTDPDSAPSASELASDAHQDTLEAMLGRTPYVGAGADGARRSAQIDREELDTLDLSDEDTHPRARRLSASAEAWDLQADAAEAELRARITHGGAGTGRRGRPRARVYLTAAELTVALKCLGAAARGQAVALRTDELEVYVLLIAKLGRATLRVVAHDGTGDDGA